MQCTVVPILEKMASLYRQPRNAERFQLYLSMLQGQTKGDLVLPIGGYNPMGKEHVLEKIQHLMELKAESLAEEALSKMHKELDHIQYPDIELVINVADDLGGAWTNHFTTDFSSKFDINALIKRNFCTPYFWTSESYSESLIVQRTIAYVYRTLFWIQHGQPTTLADHFNQEVYVQSKVNASQSSSNNAFDHIHHFYETHQHTEDYTVIFNFFYGDEASNILQYQPYGMKKNEGFAFANYSAGLKEHTFNN